ncbi:MAG TPA: polyprenyl synthetase family protein, partial [Mycobacteriales bacterium]
MNGPGAADLDFADPALAKSVRAGLDRVEERLAAAVHTDAPFIAEPARHLVVAGGKRFRPLLVLLAAHFGDPDAPGVIPSAVVVELTHLATLYHDDVMDEADVRRGAVSANTRWTNTIAILTGDFLFARASDTLADLGPEAVRLQARTFERLVTGQIRETVGPEEGADPVEHYLRVVAEKTGSLIATSARFGAMFAGADRSVIEALQRYGEVVGTAFQLSDDLLDITSLQAQSGKTPGTDLR